MMRKFCSKSSPAAAATATLVLASATTTAAAWTYGKSVTPIAIRSRSTAFLGRRSSFSSVAVLNKNYYALRNNKKSCSSKSGSSTGMTMFFGSLFNDGGSYNLKVNYEELDHPGLELAKMAEENKVPVTSEVEQTQLSIATFAGGCFWGLELAYQRVPGVVYTAVGYTQGLETFPNYDQVCSGATGHTEAVVVYYNADECSYEQLLDLFFQRVDPLTVNGQGRDYGRQYRTGVYWHNSEQEKVARDRFASEQTRYKRPIATELLPAKPFWPAEKYHQQYLEKGGRFGNPQDASKNATSEIRCYG